MPLDAAPRCLDEPEGIIPFDALSSHEIIEIISIVRSKALGLLLESGHATSGDHLEPIHFWRAPFRGGVIVIRKGHFSGAWSVDYERALSEEGKEFQRQIIQALEACVSPTNKSVFRSLEHCDIHGCPLGRVNWN
jgi:hypothetical protein